MVDQIQGLGSMMGIGRPPKAEPLTEDQKNQVQTILSQYDPANVSTDDAKAIFQAFKDAGIRPAKGMKEAIEAAGFNADELREMGQPKGPPPPPPGMGNPNASRVNLSTLRSLQEILSQYNLNDLSQEDTTSLLTGLQEKGFLNTGSVIDLKS